MIGNQDERLYVSRVFWTMHEQTFLIYGFLVHWKYNHEIPLTWSFCSNIPVMSVFNMSPSNLQRVAGGSLIASRNSPAPLRKAMESKPAFGTWEKKIVNHYSRKPVGRAPPIEGVRYFQGIGKLKKLPRLGSTRSDEQCLSSVSLTCTLFTAELRQVWYKRVFLILKLLSLVAHCWGRKIRAKLDTPDYIVNRLYV